MKNRWVIPSFLLVIVTLFVGGYVQATLNQYNEFSLVLHLVTEYLFAWTVIAETKHSVVLSKKDKNNWCVIMLLSPIIFGSYYLFSMRKKIFPTTGGYSI
jgi:hypothetical protein